MENGPDPSFDFLGLVVAELPRSAPWRARLARVLALQEDMQGRRSLSGLDAASCDYAELTRWLARDPHPREREIAAARLLLAAAHGEERRALGLEIERLQTLPRHARARPRALEPLRRFKSAIDTSARVAIGTTAAAPAILHVARCGHWPADASGWRSNDSFGGTCASGLAAHINGQPYHLASLAEFKRRRSSALIPAGLFDEHGNFDGSPQ